MNAIPSWLRWSNYQPFWQKLNYRDQLALIWGGFIVLFLLFILGVMQPIHQAVDEQKEKIREQAELLAWIKNLPPETKKLSQLKHSTPSELISIIEKQLTESKAFKLFPYQLSQPNTSDLDIQFKEVPFESFMIWLWKLSSEFSFQILLFEAKQGPREGISTAHLVIRPTT